MRLFGCLYSVNCHICDPIGNGYSLRVMIPDCSEEFFVGVVSSVCSVLGDIRVPLLIQQNMQTCQVMLAPVIFFSCSHTYVVLCLLPRRMPRVIMSNAIKRQEQP
jgi:hypothetical protein